MPSGKTTPLVWLILETGSHNAALAGPELTIFFKSLLIYFYGFI